MKPYEEVCFQSGIIRWTRENNLYVCRLTEDQINEIKEIHEKPWVGLTDDEVDDIGCDFATLGGDIEGKNWFAFYLAIEAKLKEKNNG